MSVRPHVKLTKRLGQHLLVDGTYLRKVAEGGDVGSMDLVLEVGPGTGNLTELLAGSAKRVLAVELDSRLYGGLKARFTDRFELFEGDILAGGRINPAVVARLPARWALVANLPYNVAGPVMVEAFYLANPPKFMCVTIQREVAKRIAAAPGGKTYGVLSVLLQAVADVKILATVPPGAFLPPPKVESAIIRMTWNAERAAKIKDRESFRDLAGRLFQHRRKTLRGGWLRMLGETERSRVAAGLERLGIDPVRRPETLTVEEVVGLADILGSLR